MPIDIKALEQKRSEVAAEMRAIVATAEKEDRGLTDEERGKFDTANVALEGFEERIKVAQQMNDEEARASEPVTRAPVINPGEDMAAAQERAAEMSPEERHADAFGQMLRSGEPGLAGLSLDVRKVLAEKRAQATDPGSAGGFLVPQGFGDRIIEAQKQFGGLVNVATVFNTESGNALPFPTNDDTTNIGEIVGENVQAGEEDLVFGSVALGAYKYSSKIVRVSLELMQDSAFDLDAYIARKFGQRIGRAQAEHYAVGTGTGQPRGLFTAATSGTTAASATAVTYNELLALKHSVDPAYRDMPHWLFNDATLKALKQLSDSEGRPLWMPNVAAGVPATLDGDPYQIDQSAPDMETGATPVAYGDMSEYYIRNVMGFTLLRLIERYAEFGQVGFIAHQRSDGNLMDTMAVKKLTMA